MPVAVHEFVALRGKKIEYGGYLRQIRRLKRNNDTENSVKQYILFEYWQNALGEKNTKYKVK